MTVRHKQGKDIVNRSTRPFVYVRMPDGGYLEVTCARADEIVHAAVLKDPAALEAAVKDALENGHKS